MTEGGFDNKSGGDMNRTAIKVQSSIFSQETVGDFCTEESTEIVLKGPTIQDC